MVWCLPKSKQAPSCWQELNTLRANKCSCSCGTGPTRFSFSDSELRLLHCLPAYLPTEQANKGFPGGDGKLLIPPTSALWLSLRGATDTMETFNPSSSKMPWIFKNVLWSVRWMIFPSIFPFHFLILCFPSAYSSIISDCLKFKTRKLGVVQGKVNFEPGIRIKRVHYALVVPGKW